MKLLFIKRSRHFIVALLFVSASAAGQSWLPGNSREASAENGPVTLSLEGGNVQIVSQRDRISAFPAVGAGVGDQWPQNPADDRSHQNSAYGQIQYNAPPISTPTPVPPVAGDPQETLPTPHIPSQANGDANTSTAAANTSPACVSGTCGQPGYGGVGSVYGRSASEFHSWSGAAGRLPEHKPVGLFFRWDRLYTTIESAASGRFGRPAPGSVINDAIPVSSFVGLGNDLFDERPKFGDRLEFGFHDRSGDGSPGWMMSILLQHQTKNFQLSGGVISFADPLGLLLGFADTDLDGFGDDQDGDLFFGADGQDTDFDGIPDTPAPQDDDDLISFLPVYDDITGRNRIEMDGFEGMRFRPLGEPTNGLYWMHGFRYFNLEERFTVTATGSFLDFNTDTHVENFVLGPQVGVGCGRCFGPFRFDGVIRFMAGVNRQRGKQTSNLSGFGGAALNQPLNPIAAIASSSIQEDTQFSPILEWRAEVSHYFTRFTAFRVGYTGWYVGGVTRASSLNYSLPDLGLDLGASDSVLANALTLGLEFSF